MLMRTLCVLGLVAAGVSGTAGCADAVPLTDSQIFSQFNAVIFGNMTTSSEVEGRTVVGGNLSVSNSVNFEIAGGLAASSYGALSVYGNVYAGGATLNIDNGGVTIAGTNNASLGLNNGGAAYIGGANTGNVSVSGSGSIGIIGTNTGTLSVSSGSVYVGGAGAGGGSANSGSVTVNGGTTSPWIAVNGTNTGNLTMNGGGGSAAVNGNNSGSISGGTLSYTGGSQTGNLNGGATATQVGSLNLTAPVSTLGSFQSTFLTQLTQLSSQLNTVAANSTAALVSGSVTFNANPNSSGVAVFDINASLFNGASSITLNLDGATSVIINVNVDSCASNVCAFNPTVNFNDSSYASVLLWNFVNATNLNFTTEFGGSILAPDAAVTDSSPIDGTVVAASLSTTSELHSHPYTGTFPGGPVPAPEPASLALFGTGVAGLAAMRRRRNKKSV
jgi:choice-of-anchor A domain-containing protein